MEGVERRIDGPALPVQKAILHADSRLPQGVETTAIHHRIGVGSPHHHPPKARLNDSLGAWARLAVVAARLEGNIHNGIPQVNPPPLCLRDSVTLRMKPSVALVEPLSHYPFTHAHHGAHPRIRTRVAPPAPCNLNGARHHPPVKLTPKSHKDFDINAIFAAKLILLGHFNKWTRRGRRDQ